MKNIMCTNAKATEQKLRTHAQKLVSWCNLHNAGCIMQVAGHVLWPRAAWLCQDAVTRRRLTFLCEGDCKLLVQ